MAQRLQLRRRHREGQRLERHAPQLVRLPDEEGGQVRKAT